MSLIMTFEEKIDQLRSELSLNPKSLNQNLNHLYADYVELIALFSNNAYATAQSILNRFKQEEINIGRRSDVGESAGRRKAENNSEKNDLEEQRMFEIFEILKFRSVLFNGNYPFALKRNTIILKNILSDSQKLYLILLVSSNLNYFSIVKPELTSEFEAISSRAFKTLLPSNVIIKEFGKNSEYSGTAKEKIIQLAQDMNVEIVETEIENILGSQERGLDLVAWVPFNDNIPNMLIWMGQCACGKEWYNKQHETKRFESSYYKFYKLKPINTLFIPYSLTKSPNAFYQSDEIIEGTLLFDRKRIMDGIDETLFLDQLKSKFIVEACIEYQEDIV